MASSCLHSNSSAVTLGGSSAEGGDAAQEVRLLVNSGSCASLKGRPVVRVERPLEAMWNAAHGCCPPMRQALMQWRFLGLRKTWGEDHRIWARDDRAEAKSASGVCLAALWMTLARLPDSKDPPEPFMLEGDERVHVSSTPQLFAPRFEPSGRLPQTVASDGAAVHVIRPDTAAQAAALVERCVNSVGSKPNTARQAAALVEMVCQVVSGDFDQSTPEHLDTALQVEEMLGDDEVKAREVAATKIQRARRRRQSSLCCKRKATAAAICDPKIEVAATRIQAAQRGKTSRRRGVQSAPKVTQLKAAAGGRSEEERAASKIQAAHRGKAARRRTSQVAPSHFAQEMTAATKIQATHRGNLGRRAFAAAKNGPNLLGRCHQTLAANEHTQQASTSAAIPPALGATDGG